MAKVRRGLGHTDDQGERARWMLGFDGGCVACSKLAREVEAIAGDRLSARSLADPEVRAWREAAFGPDAVWEPTLIQMAGSEVQAWTGRAMAWRLTRLVGPKATYRIAKVVAHLDDESGSIPDPSRRAFMRRVGGMVIGAGLLAIGPKALALAKAAGTSSSSTAVVKSTADVPATEATRLAPSLTKYAATISSFGTPDWSSLRRVTYTDSSIVYLLGLVSTSAAMSSAVVFDDPAAGTEIPPLIARLSIDSNGASVFQFTTGVGNLIGNATLNRQHLVPYGERPPGVVEPDFNWSCFWPCCSQHGLTLAEAETCAACLSGNPFACAGCVGYAGVAAYYCYRQCSSSGGGGGGGCGGCKISAPERGNQPNE